MGSKTSRGGGMDTHRTGQLIAARRKELGLTQKQLAGQLNVSDRAVSKWERAFRIVKDTQPAQNNIARQAGHKSRPACLAILFTYTIR